MLYVVVPVHNRVAITTRFLDSLGQQNLQDYLLVLVDDGCTDGTVETVAARVGPERLMVLRGDGNLWWAGALQLAYDALKERPFAVEDAVLIVNDDVRFDNDFLRAGLGVLQRHPEACIQAIGIDRASGDVDRGAIADLHRLRFRGAGKGELPDCLSTRGLMMRASTFVQSGGFRPQRLPHYLSDYEFTLRLHRRGTPLLVDDSFCAEVDLSLTGLSEARPGGLRQVWRDSLSNRAKFNPKHWSAFALMVCPPWIGPVHAARIWIGFGRALLRALLPHPSPLRDS